MNYAYVNESIVDSSKATVSIFDRGLILGDGLFETVKAVNGIPEFFEDHWKRLSLSSKKLLINIEPTETGFRNIIKELCDKNQLNSAAVRITITRGISSGLSIDSSVKPTVIVTALPITWLDESLYLQGVRVVITSVKRSSASGIDGHIKTTNYLANIMAKHEADSRGGYEGIFLTERGEIAEMTTSSFFCVRDGVLYTPPLDEDILPGITRQQILKGASVLGIEVREEHLLPSFLLKSEEAFLTSSVRGVVPIASVDEYQFIVNGPVTQALSRQYQSMAKDNIAD